MITKNYPYIADPKVKLFIEEIIEVYEKHQMSLSHEDGHGAFIIYTYKHSHTEWLRSAFDERDKKKMLW